MRSFLILLLLSVIVWACAESSSSDQVASTSSTSKAKPKPKAKAVNGEKIYKVNCVACHGLYGDMGASGAANLQESALAVEERIAVITNGRNTMTAFGSLLSEEKIKAVAEFTMTLKK